MVAEASAPGRCFVCLTDEDPSDGDDWVKPCPCTLEGHQACMLQYIDELDRERKPYLCPICKTEIQVYSPVGTIVRLHEGIYKNFARLSPIILGAGFLGGTVVGLSAYGVVAFRTVAGLEALKSFLQPHPGSPKAAVHFLSLSAVAPALVIGQSLPDMGRILINPVAFVYGLFSVTLDHRFFSWPPSPQAAFTALPYIHLLYRQLWDEFLRPHELRFERRALGLPDPQPRRERNRQQDARPAPRGRAAAGIIGLLDIAINLLDIPDVDIELEIQQEEVPQGQEGQANQIEIEFGVGNGDEEVPLEEMLGANPEAAAEALGGDLGDIAERRDEDDAAPPPPPIGIPAPDAEPAAAAQPPQPAGGGNVQWDLTSALLNLSGAITADLLLPVFASAAGELLKAVLPKRFTVAAPLGSEGRPGMLTQIWGRSLVGGGLYIIVRDLLRFYIKYRKAGARPRRRVKNVDRRRAKNGGSTSSARG